MNKIWQIFLWGDRVYRPEAPQRSCIPKVNSVLLNTLGILPTWKVKYSPKNDCMLRYFFASCTQWIINSRGKHLEAWKKIANCDIQGNYTHAIEAKPREAYVLPALVPAPSWWAGAHFPVSELSGSGFFSPLWLTTSPFLCSGAIPPEGGEHPGESKKWAIHGHF